MRIQYMSDLHLEFQDNCRLVRDYDFPVTGEILVLAGDTMYLKDRTTAQMRFWKWASANFHDVLLVPGNHEYYGDSDVMDRGLQWNWMFRENVGYYQNQVKRIGDTDLILSTLWSHVPPEDEYLVQRGLNDFYQTRYDGHRLTVEKYNEMHRFCLDFIKKSVAESTADKIVVVTHHLPTRLVVAPEHKGSRINSAFSTELGDFIADSRINTWIYGHSHTNIDTVIGNTKIVSNQIGYTFRDEHLYNGFEAGKYIEI